MITDSQQQKSVKWGGQSGIGDRNSLLQLLKPWPGSQVRVRCSSIQQMAFFHLGAVFNSLQEVCLLKDFVFIKYPSPNLIIPEVFRCADHRRRKYWSFLLSKPVNFLYKSGRTNLDTEDPQDVVCSGWNSLYHFWLSYSSALFLGNLLLQQ